LLLIISFVVYLFMFFFVRGLVMFL